MKKLLSILLIFVLIFSCVGCQKSQDITDSLSKKDRKALNNIINEKTDAVIFTKPIYEHSNYTFCYKATDGDKRYTFKNEHSAFLINYTSFHSSIDQNVSCSCQKEYRIYSFYCNYEDSLFEDYYIGFVNGIVHITDSNGYHLVMSKEDSKLVKQIIDTYCKAENIVT